MRGRQGLARQEIAFSQRFTGRGTIPSPFLRGGGGTGLGFRARAPVRIGNIKVWSLPFGFQERSQRYVAMRQGLGRLGSNAQKRQSKVRQRFFGNRECWRASLRWSISLCHCRVERKRDRMHARVKRYWEIIADNLKKADWCCACISNTDHKGRQFWIVAAEREDAGRFIVH